MNQKYVSNSWILRVPKLVCSNYIQTMYSRFINFIHVCEFIGSAPQKKFFLAEFLAVYISANGISPSGYAIFKCEKMAQDGEIPFALMYTAGNSARKNFFCGRSQ